MIAQLAQFWGAAWENAGVDPATSLEAPELKFVSANGLRVAMWDWPGADPPLVFAHATGFHGRCWDRIAHAFPGRRRLAVEFRGHGRSDKPVPPYRWPEFGRELAAVAAAFEIESAVGAGHSMGGYALVAAALDRPGTFAALLLIDPTIFPVEYYSAPPIDASFIRRRRNLWRSADQMFQRFRERGPFTRWRPEVLRDYCDFALLANDGQWALACPPDVEASIYEHSNMPEANLHPAIPSIREPAVVLRAGKLPPRAVFDPAASPTAPDLAAKFPRGRDIWLRDRDHFIPMESPEIVIEEMRKLCTR